MKPIKDRGEFRAMMSLAIIDFNGHSSAFDEELDSKIKELSEMLDCVINQSNYEEIYHDVITKLFNDFNQYKKQFSSVKKNIAKHSNRLEPYFDCYHDFKNEYFKALHTLNEKVKKYETIVDVQMMKCIEYLNDHNIGILI